MSTKNSYVGAAHDYESDSVLVWERADSSERILKRMKAPRYFYAPAEDGEYTSMFGEKLEKIVASDLDDWNMLLKQYRNKHESDIQPLFKILMNEYYKVPPPILNFAFVDIETDTLKEKDWDLSKKIKVRQKS